MFTMHIEFVWLKAWSIKKTLWPVIEWNRYIYFWFNDKVVGHVLRTQNKYGGYCVKYNSSACEDIDFIDILERLASYVPLYKIEIYKSLQKSFNMGFL